jgi:CubicO group peptidase (beta-lactamase class C family)
VAIMQLVEAGLINLDEPVQKHLPWFETLDSQGSAITISHLLYQTSGFSEIEGVEANLQKDGQDALKFAGQNLNSSRLNFSPGEDWEYSNINYLLLGLIVQEVSGQSYESYIQENIFTPLEMTDSYTSRGEAEAAGATKGYYPFFGYPVIYNSLMPYSRATLPAGGLWSSASDLSHFMIAQLNDGRYGDETILSPDSLNFSQKPGHIIDDGFGYGMGWWTNRAFLDPEYLSSLGTDLDSSREIPIIYQEGDWANYSSIVFLIPEIDFGVTILMNTFDPAVDSAFRGFAFDLTLIANGGNAQYFSAWEEGFIVKYSRQIFSIVALLLFVELVWSLRKWNNLRNDNSTNSRKKVIVLQILVPLVIDIALVGYFLWKVLPDAGASPIILIRHAPDLGILFIVIMILAVGWGIVRTLLCSITLLSSR